jgi:GNAT superfamily N-acetyltransferase
MDENKEKINLDDIKWIEANMDWMRGVIFDYERTGKDLGMDFLSMGALRYDEKYFVGYLYNKDDIAHTIDLVSYIQYETRPNKLVLNYLDVAKKYRGNGVARKTINAFFNSMPEHSNNPNAELDITSLSPPRW